MFVIGTALFLIASLVCGLAWSGSVLIGARVLQGVSAAIMAPTALSILMTTFEEGPERNKALGIWSAIGGVGATAALLIGGPLTDALGWEWIFFINVPVAIGLLALGPILLRESRGEVDERAYDLGGAVTVTAALVLASALNNAAFQIGGALGTAVVTTVAISETAGPDPLSALTEGFQSAFAAAAAFAALGVLYAILLLGRRGRPAPLGSRPAAAPTE
jgi:MFS family permease